jgi:hypothetical protein
MKSTPDILQTIVEFLTRKTKFYGFYPYVVTDETMGRPSLKAIGVIDGQPSDLFADQLHIDKAHGIPGAYSELVKDTIVLVGFKAGDPGSPFVGFYIPNQLNPNKVTITATSWIKLITAPGDGSLVEFIGAEIKAGGSVPVALAGGATGTDAALNTLRLAINSLGGAVPPLSSTAAQKLTGA